MKTIGVLVLTGLGEIIGVIGTAFIRVSDKLWEWGESI